MPDYKRSGGPLLFGQGQKLRSKLPHHGTVERHRVCNHDTVQHGEQQKRVLKMLSTRFSFFNKQTSPLHGGFGFRRSIPFGVH